MKRHSKILAIIVVLIVTIVTHFAAYIAGIYRYLQTDYCASETEMIPIELATNVLFIAACETIRNTTNQINRYEAASLCVPFLSNYLRGHPDGIHYSVVSSLFGIEVSLSSYETSLFLKTDGCYVFLLSFESMRSYHITSVLINMGIM